MSQTDFAKIYGISVVYAGQLLTLADAPPEVKDAVDKDVISGTAAIELVRDAGPDGAVEVVEALTSQLPEVSPSTPVGTGSTSDTRPRSGARNAPKAFTGAQVREAANKLGKTRSSPAPKTRSPSKGTHLPSPERDTRISAEDARTMLQRFINSTDRLIAQHKKGIDTADTILNMAMTLRDAAILGVAAESRLTEIDANTPDEWFSW
jgi:hypothetical protein